ncbi:MAG: STY4528 family pathogenicity island replication protein [Nevskia sp.]|nr:STY4528 family pathogenicity island replication protein [Nevskia sp.]
MLHPGQVPGAARERERGAVSARTTALEALIQSSLEALRDGHAESRATEALLFVGHWNDSLPRLLLHDAVLEPVDKIVWAVIKTRADPARGTAFPSYTMIGRLANVGSEATVSRALAILRVTRWLTACGRVRDFRGRFRGNVYVLHDEPLSLVDTLYLDPAYMAFTRQSMEHRHARVAQVAGAVIRSLELDLAEGVDVLLRPDPLVDRLGLRQAEMHDGKSADGQESATTTAAPSTVYGLRFRLRRQLAIPSDEAPSGGRQLQNLKTVEPAGQQQILPATDHLQNLKLVDPQNLRAQKFLQPQNLCPAVVVGSSENTTTTTAPRPTAKSEVARGAPDADLALAALRWPPALSTNYRHLAAIQLRSVPLALRQEVLDILDGRLRAIERGADPLHYGPMAYLKTLCAKAASGQLVPRQPVARGSAPTEAERPAAPDPAVRLEAELRVARSDLAHWQRLTGLEPDAERGAPLRRLADEAQHEVERIAGKLVALRQEPPATPAENSPNAVPPGI